MLSSTARHKLTALLLIGLVAAVAAPSAASAAPGTGTVTLGVGGKGKAAKALAAAGVEARAIGPARKRGARIALPVSSVTVARSARVALRGRIVFRAGRRTAKLKSLQLVLGSRRATVSAKVGKRRTTFFAASLPARRVQLDRSGLTATAAGGKLRLTRAGARRLRAKLGASRIAAGALGSLAADARPSSDGSGGGGKTPGGGTGGGGGGGPTAGPIKSEPPLLARPAGAVDVVDASLTWRPRESWIQYINTGEGTSVFGGAANGPAEVKPGSSASLVYSFHGFPFKSGWYHAASGAAALYFGGGVGFRYSGHGIDFSSANPEIEINGAASRAIFTFNGSQGTRYDNQRGVLVDLHPSPIQTPPNGTVTYTDVPATVPADAGASVFAGFYSANAPFGSMTVSFSTP